MFTKPPFGIAMKSFRGKMALAPADAGGTVGYTQIASGARPKAATPHGKQRGHFAAASGTTGAHAA